MQIELPCMVGDTVFAFVNENGFKKQKSKYKKDDLTECIITTITFEKDFDEPLFTAVDYHKCEYDRFWLSEFGKLIYTKEQYFNLRE